MSSYPRWFCPVFLCNWSSSYSNNVKKHLSNVHGWSEEVAEEEVSRFFQAHEEGSNRINNKAPFDPTNPNNWDRRTVVSREAERSEADRSFVGGGGVE